MTKKINSAVGSAVRAEKSGSAGGLELQESASGVASSSGAAGSDISVEGTVPTTAPSKRVKSVKINAHTAIDRVEFEYTDGSKWSIGGPGGNKGIAPLVLAADEYIQEVRHESLPQWWYVGASIEFKTNKGRTFRHVSHWGSGEEEHMTVFRAPSGSSIMALKLHDGVLQGIVEGECHVGQNVELEMFSVYWLESARTGGEVGGSAEVRCPKGHSLRQDWGRAGHICDECSRRGTVARCGGGCDYDLCEVCFRHHSEGWASAVQKRGFRGRDEALRFAAQRGAGPPALLVLGPLRLELEDHPWLDAYRELGATAGRWLSGLRYMARAVRGSSSRARSSGSDSLNYHSSLRDGPLLPRSMEEGLPPANVQGTTEEGVDDLGDAGLVVDVMRGARVKAWGSPTRLSMCEKAAADVGEIDLHMWATRSSSLKGYVDWVKATIPLLWRVLSLLDWRKNARGSALVALTIVVRSICDGWQPVLTGAVFNLVNGDKHEVERESKFLYYLCSWTFGCTGRLSLARSVILGLMLAAFLQGSAKAMGNDIKKRMRDQQSTELRSAMFEHLLAQDQALYDTLRRGDLIGKAELRAIDQVTEWVWGMASDVTKLATQLVFLFAISPVMTLVYTLLLPALEQVTRKYLERGARAQRRREEGQSHVSHYVIHEAVTMIRTIKTFSREDKHVALVTIAAGCAAADLTATGRHTPKINALGRQVRSAAISVFHEVSQRAVYCFCLWCGLIWMEQDFSAGDMTAYLLLIQQVGGLVTRVRSQFRDLKRRHDVLQEHFEFMDRIPQIVPGSHGGEVLGHVEFQDVKFSYPSRPDVVVLKGVTFEMKRGEMTALVGASGSGKTTVAALIFRHYDPDSGAIKIDGFSLREWDTTALHSQMALVAQQPLLFDTSIRNNLTYGCRWDVTDEEIDSAVAMANAKEFIDGFPAGYDTYVGDQGAHISGGQKQRISIARAVILRPRILVLDEATSALDAEAEGIVQDALDSVMVDRTTLVIAHRLSTIKSADQIMCMRDGLIVECGSPKALLAKQGYYWSLVRRQVCTADDLSGFNLELDQKPLSVRTSDDMQNVDAASDVAERVADARAEIGCLGQAEERQANDGPRDLEQQTAVAVTYNAVVPPIVHETELEESTATHGVAPLDGGDPQGTA
eukprot:TRINITY_DN38712_c0_g1_i1.p1 TRINITY_DN38712_c0_g1~~TRINITY_DN38712_c0_g1_i1.p1  ORF type:complete len:1150 (-),score=163.35 TRINITY_DN38712_c0_g1_i1:37-3486(-)